ncbi:MAG: glutamine synthetase III [Lachnospiraceae bacterium]|nr:glutamine synthetase III [Lachnospiraceae bacterium]
MKNVSDFFGRKVFDDKVMKGNLLAEQLPFRIQRAW